MVIKDDIFRQYDIRGIVGKDLDAETACEIGRAFSVHPKGVNPSAKRVTVTVGRDVRLSSKELSDGIIKGILTEGIDVCDIGECPKIVRVPKRDNREWKASIGCVPGCISIRFK